MSADDDLHISVEAGALERATAKAPVDAHGLSGGASDRAVAPGPVVPLRPRFLRVGGLRINYVDVGSGPVVVLLHGIGHNIYGWRKTIGPLASAGFRVMAVDLPGFGRSDAPEKIDPDTYMQVLVDWLDLHCIERASFVGNSMGGAISATFAALHPDRVERIALLDPSGFGREVSWWLRLASVAPLQRLLPHRVSRLQVRTALRQVYFNPALIEDAEVDRLTEDFSRPGVLQTFQAIAAMALGLRGLRSDFSIDALPSRIEAPTLVVWGDHDRIIPVAHLELARQAIPHAETVIFERCGHCPQLERPRLLNERLRRFLGAGRAGSAGPAPSVQPLT
ncbi:MAG: alpha/beta fold hydrolase [Candidatus Dormibacteria bacterium]